jgi:clan AA aspartic protease
MGLTHVDLKLTNLFNGKSMSVRTLVDTGAMFLCVTQEVAVQLGFDTEEAEAVRITVADGRGNKVPKVAPIRVEFANRSYVTEAFVIGDEPLLGAVPIEAMDLIVDPSSRELRVNPAHPNYPVFPVK